MLPLGLRCGHLLILDTVAQVHDTGFFSLVNTGFSEEEVQRQYDIGQGFFNLPVEDKGQSQYRCDFSKGNYFGYRAVRGIPENMCLVNKGD